MAKSLCGHHPMIPFLEEIANLVMSHKLIAGGHGNGRSKSLSDRIRILESRVQRHGGHLRLQSSRVLEPRVLTQSPALLLPATSPSIPAALPKLFHLSGNPLLLPVSWTLRQDSAQTITPLSDPLRLGSIHPGFSPLGCKEKSSTNASSNHLCLPHRRGIWPELFAGNSVTLSAVPLCAVHWTTPVCGFW